MNKYLKYGLLVFVLITIFELVLRICFGLGNPVLYIENKNFEYIYAPNQNVVRFRNHIITNEYSMRSLPVSDSDSIRILKVGDSIINGGSLTDHDSLASSLLEKHLQAEFKCKIRVLNISAGSWGPDNAFEYIHQYGTFDSKFMVLVFSSHDLYDSMGHEHIVDVDPSYPSTKPFCAISELFSRYIIPICKDYTHEFIKKPHKKIDKNHINYTKEKVNTGWKKFFDYAFRHQIKLFVVLHPTVDELKDRKYNSDAEKIITMLDSANVPYILELNNRCQEQYYRDDIHYNAIGQLFLASELYPVLKSYVENTLERNKTCKK
jgi:hypothetical protein